jgi:5'-3' exonuclease
LLTRWGARISYGQEADDSLGIAQSWMTDTIICSIDKDLLQIPGKHYNFVKKEFLDVSRIEGLQHFFKQILIGDTADNIGGCKGIGPVKAERLLGGLGDNIQALATTVLCTYCSQLKIDTKDEATVNEVVSYITKVGQVLKIRQQEDEPLWRFPLENPMEILTSLSLQLKDAEDGLSSGRITQDLNGVQSRGKKMEESSKTTPDNLT